MTIFGIQYSVHYCYGQLEFISCSQKLGSFCFEQTLINLSGLDLQIDIRLFTKCLFWNISRRYEYIGLFLCSFGMNTKCLEQLEFIDGHDSEHECHLSF